MRGRLDPEIDRKQGERSKDCKPDDRRCDLPSRHASGAGHNDFIIPVELVQRPDGCDENGERRQQSDDLRRAKRHDIEEGQRRLPVLDDQIGLRQALRQNGKQGQAADNYDNRAEHLLEEIALDAIHGRVRCYFLLCALPSELIGARRCLVSATNGVYS